VPLLQERGPGILLSSWPVTSGRFGRRGLLILLILLLVLTAASAEPFSLTSSRSTDPDPIAVSAGIAVTELLTRQSQALLRRDAREWSVGVDPQAPGFAARHDAVFDRLAELPVTRWGYEVLRTRRRSDMTVPAGGDAMVEARVRTSYRLAPDSRDLVRDRTLTLVRRSGQWLIASDSGGSTQWDLWELGPVVVRRTECCLVIADRSAADLVDRILTETEAATALLGDLWPTVRMPTPVILVAAGPEQVHALVPGIDQDALASIAAVTAGPLDRTPERGEPPSGTADRVVLDASVFRDLTGPGRHVVLTHELTHVLTRATAVLAPPAWLEEGLADYVAYLGTGLSAQVIAGELISAAGQGRLPAGLPRSVDFIGLGEDNGLSYERAWSAVVVISGADPGAGAGADPRIDPVMARQWQRLQRFYEVATAQRFEPGVVGTNGRVRQAAAFAGVLGTTENDFLDLWQKTVLGMVSSPGVGHDR
jgi:hypothetical protein